MIKAITVGLTGQTGAGKTTVAEILRHYGFCIIDADKAAREAVKKGSYTLERLKGAFGDDIVDENGELIRPLLAERAFKDEADERMLNSITHPEIISIMQAKTEDAFMSGYDVVVLDAPLLFETEMYKKCRFIISVTAPENVRKSRIIERDKITEAQACLRMKAQHDENYYKEKSDFVIVNDSGILNLEEKTRITAEKIEDILETEYEKSDSCSKDEKE